MDIRLLGPLEVVDDDGELVAVRGTRLQTLLAALAVECGAVVALDRLVDELWHDDWPTRRDNALQRQVSTLRRTLRARDVIQWREAGYRLTLDRSAIDLFRFEDLVARGIDALRAGEERRASALLADGLSLWRGEPFTGLSEAGLLGDESRRLAALRLTATEAHIDAELALGNHSTIVAELERLVADHPLHERFRAQLMLALSRSGRQADALRSYRSARETLAEELGIEPSAELRAVELAILRQEAGIAADKDVTVPRARTNLPATFTSLVGRVHEKEQLRRALQDHRLVTVESARDWLTGEGAEVWLVQLADVADPDDVVPTILATLDLMRAATEPEDMRRLVEFLCGRRVMLLLDDCEHVIARVAHTAERLLESCETLRIMVTSREALCITGEVISPVPPLPLDDAVTLFVERGRAVVPSLPPYDPTSPDGSMIRDVCERLDGLPLAIELAAGRLRSTSLPELATGLDDRFRLLNRGPRTARARQQTLRAVVDWSYGLLFEDERRVFDRLSVFAGGCTFDAARAVCADAEITADDVTDLVTRLADKSLVVITRDAQLGTARCTMLQTLVAYGRDRLAALNGTDAAYAKHLAYFTDVARQSMAAFRGEDQRHWMRAVEGDVDNLRAALEFAVATNDAESATALAGSLGWYWWFTGRAAEGMRWVRRAGECAGARASAGWPRLVGWSSFLSTPGFVLWAEPEAGADSEVERDDGRDRLSTLEDEAINSLREEGALDELSMLSTALSVAHSARGDHPRAVTLLTDAQRVLESLEPMPWVLAMRLYVEGRRAFTAGQCDDAEAAFRAAIARLDAIGGEVHRSFAYRYLGRLAVVRGDHRSSVEHIETSLRLAQSLGMPGFANTLVMDLADACAVGGEYERARSALDGLLAVARDLRSRRGTSESLAAMALVEFRDGRLEPAVACADDGLQSARAIDHVEAMAHCLAVLGYAAEHRGDIARASDLHGEVLSLARRHRDQRLTALALEGFAGTAMRAEDGAEAARRFGAADELRRRAGRCSGWAFSLHPRADRPSMLKVLEERASADVIRKEIAFGSEGPERILANLERSLAAHR
jgi:predicted ATPase/DNA-binding SARP family transcriptional activator